MSDADLVARARQGDDAAFGELVERHRSGVFRAALSVLGSHADADDAAQEAFVLAHRRLAGFRGESTFRTWLLRIAWNRAINRRRSVTRMLKRLVAIESPEPGQLPDMAFASPGPTPERVTLDGELRKAVTAEVKKLSPKLRDALLLVQSSEYTYEEMAAMIGTPVGTLKWRVSEARRVVRERLRKRGYGHV